jgi:uncharacterized protein (DUF2132 family)
LQYGKAKFKDPLHGTTLKSILESLDHYGFDTLGIDKKLNVLMIIQA